MSINGTLAFVILWIVNALIALVYLLVGIFLYVPACDLKREQGEEIQYDNRRAFFIRFIVMVLCPVVGPAFCQCGTHLVLGVGRKFFPDLINAGRRIARRHLLFEIADGEIIAQRHLAGHCWNQT